MWMSKEALALVNAAQARSENLLSDLARTLGENTRMIVELAQTRADLDWMKHRVNQLERERGQFFQTQLGIKIAVPEFVPTYEDPASALNQIPDLSTVGADALPDADTSGDVDYSMMPGYRK